MKQVTLTLEPAVALFYTRIAVSTGKPLEQILTDALFRLAGELSLEAIHEASKTRAHRRSNLQSE